MNITYCLGWLRTEENQYLSCPPDVARELEPELQELLGYTMRDYALVFGAAQGWRTSGHQATRDGAGCKQRQSGASSAVATELNSERS